MATAKITLIGFNNYMHSINDDLFKNLHTPSGIDKTLLINNILMLGGEYEVLWGDPFFYQNMIGVWSDKWQHTMQKWFDAINAEFNPVENYDRMEDWFDNTSKQSKVQTNDSENSISASNTNSNETTNRNENAVANDYSQSKGDGTTTNTRSAFDSADYQPHDKSESDTSGENISSGMTSANGQTNNEANSNSNNLESRNRDGITDLDEKHASLHSGRVHGNIGVTTAQKMITESLELYNWNLYDAIAELFIGEMLIYVDD